MEEVDFSLEKLARSKFRAKFKLSKKDKEYIESKGWDVIEAHAHDFISSRLSSAEPQNDGKQTPFRGHPVFIAQHATACCCRGCLEKWHKIEKGRPLTQDEEAKIVALMMRWLHRQYERGE